MTVIRVSTSNTNELALMVTRNPGNWYSTELKVTAVTETRARSVAPRPSQT